jgi:excisionase family DNA binding protein
LEDAMGRKPAVGQASTPVAESQDMFGEPLYTVKEVARALSLTEETVRDWIKVGDLMAIRFGRKEYRITQSALLQYKQDRENLARQEYEARREERRQEADLARLQEREPWAYWERTLCPGCGDTPVLTSRFERKNPRFFCGPCAAFDSEYGRAGERNVVEREVRIQVDEYNAEAGVPSDAAPEFLLYHCGICERPQMLSTQNVQNLEFYPYCSHKWAPALDRPQDSHGPYDERVLAVLTILELEVAYALWCDYCGEEPRKLPFLPRGPEALRRWVKDYGDMPHYAGPYSLKLCPMCERIPVVVNSNDPRHVVVFCRECLRKQKIENDAEESYASLDDVPF